MLNLFRKKILFNLMPRKKCLFNYCTCPCYHGSNNICTNCNHGKVWHQKTKRSTNINQFLSNRESARKPSYMFIQIAEPLIEVIAEPVYCIDLISLPV